MKSAAQVVAEPDSAKPLEIVLAILESAAPAVRRAIERGNVKDAREAAELLRDTVNMVLEGLDHVTQ